MCITWCNSLVFTWKWTPARGIRTGTDKAYNHKSAIALTGTSCLGSRILFVFSAVCCGSVPTDFTGMYNTLRPRQDGRHFPDDTFSNAFSWMKTFEFRLKFHWSLFLRVQLTIFRHQSRWWLGAVQATSHYLNQWWLVYRRIYASLGLNE